MRANITQYTCDAPNCRVWELSQGKIPDGWFVAGGKDICPNHSVAVSVAGVAIQDIVPAANVAVKDAPIGAIADSLSQLQEEKNNGT